MSLAFFWGILIACPKQKNLLFPMATKMGFALSTIFSLYVMYTWFTRGFFIFYVSALIFSLIMRKYKMKLTPKMFKSIVTMLIIGISLFFISSYITKGTRTWEDEINRFVRDSHIRILPMFVLLDNPEYRWFQDIAYIPLYFLPQKLWRNKLIHYTASEVITKKNGGC